MNPYCLLRRVHLAGLSLRSPCWVRVRHPQINAHLWAVKKILMFRCCSKKETSPTYRQSTDQGCVNVLLKVKRCNRAFSNSITYSEYQFVYNKHYSQNWICRLKIDWFFDIAYLLILNSLQNVFYFLGSICLILITLEHQASIPTHNIIYRNSYHNFRY